MNSPYAQIHIPDKPYSIPAASSSNSNSSDNYSTNINDVEKQARLSINFNIRIIHRDVDELFVNYFNLSIND